MTTATLIAVAYIVGAIITAYRIQVWLLMERDTCSECAERRARWKDQSKRCTNHWNDKMVAALIWPLTAIAVMLGRMARREVEQRKAARVAALQRERDLAAIDELLS